MCSRLTSCEDGRTAAGIPLLRIPALAMSQRSVSSSGMRLVSRTNPQMMSRNLCCDDFTIRPSRKPSLPARRNPSQGVDFYGVTKPIAGTDFAAFVAIDWADRKHTFRWKRLRPTAREGRSAHAGSVQTWVMSLIERFGGGRIALMFGAVGGGPWWRCWCNTNVLCSTRSTPLTAARLAGLFSFGRQRRPARRRVAAGSADPPSRSAAAPRTRHRRDPHTQFLVEQRRHLVDEKTRQKNRLTAQLKLYFPQVLEWFDRHPDQPLVGALLKRWPTLGMLQRARPATVLRFLEQHHSRSRRRNQQRLEAIRQARPATRDGAVVTAATAAVTTLTGFDPGAREGIGELDAEDPPAGGRARDSFLFDQLPGAGPALGPRLLAAFGTRRERFQTAAQAGL